MHISQNKYIGVLFFATLFYVIFKFFTDKNLKSLLGKKSGTLDDSLKSAEDELGIDSNSYTPRGSFSSSDFITSWLAIILFFSKHKIFTVFCILFLLLAFFMNITTTLITN